MYAKMKFKKFMFVKILTLSKFRSENSTHWSKDTYAIFLNKKVQKILPKC